MGRGPKWTERENTILEESIEADKSIQEISLKFSQLYQFSEDIHPRTPEAVRSRIKKMIREDDSKADPPKAGQRWTFEDDRRLLELYRDTNLEVDCIGQHLGRSESAVRTRVHVLGIYYLRHKQRFIPRILGKIRRVFSGN